MKKTYIAQSIKENARVKIPELSFFADFKSPQYTGIDDVLEPKNPNK